MTPEAYYSLVPSPSRQLGAGTLPRTLQQTPLQLPAHAWGGGARPFFLEPLPQGLPGRWRSGEPGPQDECGRVLLPVSTPELRHCSAPLFLPHTSRASSTHISASLDTRIHQPLYSGRLCKANLTTWWLRMEEGRRASPVSKPALPFTSSATLGTWPGPSSRHTANGEPGLVALLRSQRAFGAAPGVALENRQRFEWGPPSCLPDARGSLNHGLLSWLPSPAWPPSSQEVPDNLLPPPPRAGGKEERSGGAPLGGAWGPSGQLSTGRPSWEGSHPGNSLLAPPQRTNAEELWARKVPLILPPQDWG